jgi:hypothetical protein
LEQDAHVRPKLSRLYRKTPPSDAFRDQSVEVPGSVGRRGLVEAGAPAFPGIGQQGELRDEQNGTGHVTERQVHLAMDIAEHSKRCQFLHHVLYVNFSVTLGDAQEDQHSTVDLTGGEAINLH